MASPPIKISLKNTTKMTLNSRFTSIMKSRPTSSTQAVRNNASNLKAASEKNRRLSKQMERRPAVEAALGIKKQQPKQMYKAPEKPSVLNRLGVKAQTRLRGVTGARFLANKRGINRLGTQQQTFKNTRGRGRGRGAISNRIGRGAINQANNTNNQQRGKGQKRGGRGAARGRGSFRGRGGKKTANKDDLDNDLDKYMSKTKSSMDAELEQYMADAGK